MKKLHELSLKAFAVVVFLTIGANGFAQSDSTSKKTLILTPGYFLINNQTQYIAVQAKTKIDRKFQPVGNLPVSVYLDGTEPKNLLSKVLTNSSGVAKLPIPVAFQSVWKSSVSHTITAIVDANKDFDETKAEAKMTRSKITLDTLEGRNISVMVTLLNEKQEWIPVKGVEMKLGIHRLNSLLPINAEVASYTTDSLGQVNAEFKRDSMPGDIKGEIVVAAVVEDNETLGNLTLEKAIPWGKYVKPENNFDRRTLYATRHKTPVWLLFIAYSIIISVWGVILFLLNSVYGIRKIGMA